MQIPGPEHVIAAKRVLRYLNGTTDLGLVLGEFSGDSLTLSAYADSDWARDLDNRTSITGYALFLGKSCVNSIAKNQDRVALSSTEAEYIALSACSSKVVWARQILDDIGNSQPHATVVYEDNKPCIDLAHNAILSERTMHVDVKCHKTRERIKRGIIEVKYVPTDQNVADALTKPLGRLKFQAFRDQLCGRSAPFQLPQPNSTPTPKSRGRNKLSKKS